LQYYPNGFARLTCNALYRNVSEAATTTEVSFTDPDETEMGSSDLEGENISYDQNTERGSSIKSSQQELKEKGKNKN
jgi:hypothetical protein